MSTVFILPIKRFDGYGAGTDGNIYSFRSRGEVKYCNPPLRLRAKKSKSTNYYEVSILFGDGRFKTISVHTLVCTAYHGDAPTRGHEVSHLDGNGENNRPENLKWETRAENHAHKYDHGTMLLGYKNSRAKLNEWQYRVVCRLLESGALKNKEIADLFGCQSSLISNIYKGRAYRHNSNYSFLNADKKSFVPRWGKGNTGGLFGDGI